MSDFTSHMDQALIQARLAQDLGEVPVGAVVVDPGGKILGAGHNLTRSTHDPSAHAEVIAIRQACNALQTDRLPGCDLYVTLEPCAACAGIISAARIARLYFGAFDPKSGGVEQGARVFEHPQAHHKPEVYGGIQEIQCAEILSGFFAQKRGDI